MSGVMLVDYSGASPLASVLVQIAIGHASGSWTGAGITSSAARAAAAGGAARRTAIGIAEASALFAQFPAAFEDQLVDSTSLILRYGLAGDANLNGTVNLADFNRLASNFGHSGKYWFDGDFDYDGIVNLADFNLLAGNFGFAAFTHDPTPQDWANLAAAVPEPNSLFLAAPAPLLPAFQRRRRHARFRALRP